MQEETRGELRTWSVLRRYVSASFAFPVLLAIAVLGILAIQAAALIGPLYLKDFVNLLASPLPRDVVTQSLFGILMIYAFIQALHWAIARVMMYANMRLQANVMTRLTNEAFAYLIGHGYDFFTSNFTGSLTRKVGRYARAYEQILDSFLFNFLPTIIFALGSIAVLYMRHIWLGIALAAWLILFVTLQAILTRWHHPLRKARVAADSQLTGFLSDAITNHSTVTLFAAEQAESSSFAKVTNDWRTATLRAWFANNWVQGVQHALGVIVEIGLLIGAVFLWQRGLLTIGDFVLMQVYIIGLIERVWNIGNVLRRISEAFADASEMVEILETPHAIQDVPNAALLRVTRGAIAFKDVLFHFNKERVVLDDFSLYIQGGEKIALVGPSGAGKTTVTKLLLRFYDPIRGAIIIDGQEIQKVTQQSLRSQIAFVPQEPLLFHRTLKENIRYGKENASDDEVLEAAKRAHCHEFISALPQGYGTLVGERGIKLSGGERQRVAIARAILKNAPILILDEATSSLDSESEALIQEAFEELMKGKTVIAIAHRLSTIMKMDRIIVMEHGKAMLSGTHKELISQEDNLYKKLWGIQAGGFLGGAEDDEE